MMPRAADRSARTNAVLVAGVVAAIPVAASAQSWSVQAGGSARIEYNDNYFFTPTDSQSAFTTSITPFVTALRRTERSEVVALLGVGANLVSGSVSTTDYLSGRFTLDATQRDEISAWTGQVSLTRSPSLQNVITPSGVVLSRADVDNATVSGGYKRTLSDAWSIGATAMAYANRYEAVQSDNAFEDNRGYSAGGSVDYVYSDRTRLSLATVFSHFSSDIDRSDAVTAMIGATHEPAPRWTISVAAGGYWLKSDSRVNTSDDRRDNGALLKATAAYDFDERTKLALYYAESLVPSGTGIFSKDDNAYLSLAHAFSDRLTARIGAGYTRSNFPTVTEPSTTKYYLAEVGASYRFAERWVLDAGYRYSRARYAQSGGEPRGNVVFLNVSYNWPGASITDWLGSHQGAQPERAPFDQYWLP